jgi:hypothetical protein
MYVLQVIYVEMFESVAATMKEKMVIWQGEQKIVDCVDALAQYIHDIHKCSMEQLGNRPLIGAIAKNFREEMSAEANTIKIALSLYYGFNGMIEEQRMFSFPKSRFDTIRKNDFYLLTKDIADRANALTVELGGLHITPQMIASLTQNVNKYFLFLEQKEKCVELRRSATTGAKKLVNDCRLMLRNRLDLLMKAFYSGNHDFLMRYQISRKLIHKGGRRNYYTVIVSGKINDVKSRALLRGVQITPATKGKSAASDDKGRFSIKLYKKNAKTLAFTFEGYDDLIYSFPPIIKEHKMTLDVTMKKMDD